MEGWKALLIILGELFLLYFITRHSLNQLFHFLHRFLHSDKKVFSLISILFLPGTILHELSHFFMAMILFLRVRDMKVLPEWHGNYIKLGSVSYEKKDFIRSILVGIAPIVLGVIMFWWLTNFPIFSSTTPLWIKVMGVYVIFVVSTTMFSSKQDLVDIVYMIPVIIIAGIIVYFGKIDIINILRTTGALIENMTAFLYAIVNYLLVSIGVHVLFLSFIYLYKFIFHK